MIIARHKCAGLGALLFSLSIGLAAVGAHAVAPAEAQRWSAAVMQLALNALGLMALSASALTDKALAFASACVLVGVCLFCGSLFAATLTGEQALTAMAPAGGSLLILTWLAVGVRLLTTNSINAGLRG